MHLPPRNRGQALAFGLVGLVGLVGLAGCSSGISKGRRTEIDALLGKHDLDRRETTTLILAKGPGGGYELTGDFRTEVTYLAERAALEGHEHHVVEGYSAKLEELHAFLDGKELDSDSILKTTPTFPPDSTTFSMDAMIHVLRYKSVQVGQTVSYAYRLRFRELAYTPRFQIPNADRVGKWELVIRHPASVTVDFDYFYPRRRFEPVVDRKPGETRLTFVDLPQQTPALTYFPFNDLNVAVLPRLTEGGKPLNPTTVPDYARWNLALFGSLPPFTAEQKKVVASLARGAETPLAKLKAIYDFVRKEVRYIADERAPHLLIPHAPTQVLEHRYGDCKDKAALVAEMARELGLRVDPVVLSVEWRARLEGGHPSSFDHVIDSYLDGGKRIFFDPVGTFCEFGNLPDMDIEKTALVLDPSAPEKILIPEPERRPTLELELEASLADLERGRAKVVLRNSFHQAAQRVRSRERPERQRVLLSEMINARLYQIALSETRFESSTEEATVCSASVDLRRFLVRSPSQIYVPRIPFKVLDRAVLDRTKDAQPIYLQLADHVSLRLVLDAPGFRAAAGDGEARIAWGEPENASFTSERSSEGSRQIFTAFYREHRRVFEGKDRGEFLAFAKRFLAARGKMAVLEKEKP
jgi:hypothetical protein